MAQYQQVENVTSPPTKINYHILLVCDSECVETGEVCALYLTGRSDVPCTDTMTTNKGGLTSLGEGRRKNEESCIKRKHSALL